MRTWFTVKVKYTKQLDDGRLKRVTEPYLIDANSFTDAEARAYELIGETVRGEFGITGISRTEFADIFAYEDYDDWYKCKLSYIDIDTDEGKEKKVTNNFLVGASSVNEAYERINESLSQMTVSFDIPSIIRTPIVDVFVYDSELEDRIVETREEEENHEDYIDWQDDDLADDDNEVSFVDETEEE